MSEIDFTAHCLINSDSCSVWNRIIDPFCFIDGKSDTSVGQFHAETSVLDTAHTSMIINNRMEEIISVELCIIPAGICIGTERFSTTGYFEVAGYGWCGIFTRCTGQVLHCCPAAVLTVKYNGSAGVGICHDQPVCITLCRSCSGSNGTGNAQRY